MIPINDLSDLWGYMGTLDSEKAEQAVNTLNTRHCYTLRGGDGIAKGIKILTEAEFIEDSIKAGRKPETRAERNCMACMSFVCEGGGLCGRSKNIYCMADAMLATQITGEGYEFAEYLINSGLITRIPEPVKPAAEPAARRIKEAPQTKDEYESWLAEAAASYLGGDVRLAILKEVFLDITWMFEAQSASLLALIDNIENPFCRGDLTARLINNANKASITAFEHITGVKLAKGTNERAIQIEKLSKANYKGQPIAYRPRKTEDEKAYSDIFYIFCQNAETEVAEFVECRGKLWKYGGYDFFVQKHEKGYFKATEGKTGIKVADNCPSVMKLQESVKDNMERLGAGFDDRINSAVEKNGLSPLYQG